MAEPKQKTSKRGAGFLTRQEVSACKKIALATSGIARQRANALLAMHQGSTQKEAAEANGLTLGQISYLKTAFSSKRLSIFPEELLKGQSEVAAVGKTTSSAKSSKRERGKIK